MSTNHLDAKTLREAGLGAFFRPGQLAAVGISYDQLQRLVARGDVERVARGLYRLASADATEHYSLAAAVARVPNSIVCLLSALKVHGIGSQVSSNVWLAIPHKARPPRVGVVKIRLVRFTGNSWTFGVNDTKFEGVPARITSPARTIVDCFRFERIVGRNVAMEALRDAMSRRRVTTDRLMRTLDVLPPQRLSAALEMMP